MLDVNCANDTDTRLACLLDRTEISELIDRYVVTLDTAEQQDRDRDWYRLMFTDHVRLAYPIGDHTGIEGLREFLCAARLTWQVTHHVSANHVIDLHGWRATARVQIVGTHVDYDATALRVPDGHRFDTGGYYDVEAVRGPRGWRIDYLRFVLVWTSGGGVPNRDRATVWYQPAV